VELALCNLGKDCVQNAQLVGPPVSEGLRTQGEEVSAQKSICPRDLQQKIQQIEHLGGDQVGTPRLVQPHPVDHGAANVLDALLRLRHRGDVKLADPQAIVLQVPG